MNCMKNKKRTNKSKQPHNQQPSQAVTETIAVFTESFTKLDRLTNSAKASDIYSLKNILYAIEELIQGALTSKTNIETKINELSNEN